MYVVSNQSNNASVANAKNIIKGKGYSSPSCNVVAKLSLSFFYGCILKYVHPRNYLIGSFCNGNILLKKNTIHYGVKRHKLVSIFTTHFHVNVMAP